MVLNRVFLMAYQKYSCYYLVPTTDPVLPSAYSHFEGGTRLTNYNNFNTSS